MGIVDIIWLFFVISALQPLIQQRALLARRVQAIRRLEKRRGSRVITLIHRQEAFSFFGLPFARYLDIDDSEEVLRAIELTAPDVPIDLILHTPGGLVLASQQIANALLSHPAKVTAVVPHHAMSGGTLIALAADEILLSPSAVLGPVDPQLGQHPAASILTVLERKDINKIDDETLILADVSRKAIDQIRETVSRLLMRGGSDTAAAEKLAHLLSEGHWTHDYPITAETAKELGLPVATDPPDEVRQIIRLYPQPHGHRPAVEYIPTPYSPSRSPSNRD